MLKKSIMIKNKLYFMIKSLNQKLKKIKLLALDFDGILTVGGYVIVDQNGVESVVCSRKDGLGIEMIKNAGIAVVVISKEKNQVVEARCEKLNIKCWQGVDTGSDKLKIFQTHAKELGLTPGQICYGGDDVNDIACIEWAGFGFTVADGHALCKKKVDYITKTEGGRGAVREVCEMILQAQGKNI